MNDSIFLAFKVCRYRIILGVYLIYYRCDVGNPKVADAGPLQLSIWLAIGVPSARYHGDSSVGIADYGPIKTRFIGPTTGRTTTKDIEPYRLADIVPLSVKTASGSRPNDCR